MIRIFGLFLWLIPFSVSQDPSVIIIGAGAAGLSAARRLLERGINNITILEAENRIGGRIKTVQFDGELVELGARWCHGEKDNSVYELVKDLDLFSSNSMPTDTFYSTGEFLDKDLTSKLTDIISHLYYGDTEIPEKYKSLGRFCEDSYKSAISKRLENGTKELQIAEEALDLFEFVVLCEESAPDWQNMSAHHDYQQLEGNLMLTWKKGRGYKTFLDVLIKKYPNIDQELPIRNKTFLNKEVAKIAWRKNEEHNGVSAYCTDGSVYTADHLIFTASLGVLKEMKDCMFSPRLPHVKRSAIDNLGYDALFKVLMKFEEKWWYDLPEGFNFIWSKKDMMDAQKEFGRGPNWKGRSWVTYTLYSLTDENNPTMLIAWFAGYLVPEIELLDDATLIDGIHYVYQKFLGGKYNVTKPDKILRSDWGTNEHFRGVYSYQTIGTEKGNKESSANDDLAEPLKNNFGRPFVHFAGEATHPHYFSNVHAAVDTGFREGDRIADWYKK